MKRIAPLLLLLAAAVFFVFNSEILSEKLNTNRNDETQAPPSQIDSNNVSVKKA